MQLHVVNLGQKDECCLSHKDNSKVFDRCAFSFQSETLVKLSFAVVREERCIFKFVYFIFSAGRDIVGEHARLALVSPSPDGP